MVFEMRRPWTILLVEYVIATDRVLRSYPPHPAKATQK